MDSMSGEFESGPEFRQRAAEQDLRDALKEIYGHNGEFGSEEAILLGCRLVVDHYEIGVHVGDRLSDAGRFSPRMVALETERLRQIQPELSGVLADQLTGNFESTRQFVESLAGASKGSDKNLKRGTALRPNAQHRQAMLSQLASAIPEHGDPVKLSDPAWRRNRSGD